MNLVDAIRQARSLGINFFDTTQADLGARNYKTSELRIIGTMRCPLTKSGMKLGTNPEVTEGIDGHENLVH
jgi:hypothetical protein